MKKTIALLLAAVLAFSLCACGQQASSPATSSAPSETVAQSAPEVKTIKMAFSLDQMTEGNAVIVEGMNDEVAQYNAANPDTKVELTVFDANADVSKQISDVETMIVDDFDILVFSCVDAVGSVPAMEAAHNAGMKVIDVRDTDCPAADVGATLQDETVMTNKLRAWMQERLDADPDLVWNVGVVYGAPAQTLQLERGDFIKRWAEETDRVNVVVDAYGNWDTAVAMGLTEDWLQTYDDINIIVAANIGMAQGVSAALQAANVKDKVVVITFDITDDTVLNIRDGVIDASVGMNLRDVGKQYVSLGMRVYNGEYTESKYVNQDLYIVDTGNYSEYLP